MALFALIFLLMAVMSAHWRRSASARHVARWVAPSGRSEDDFRAINRAVFTVQMWWMLALAIVNGATALVLARTGANAIPWYAVIPMALGGLAAFGHVHSTLEQVAEEHGGWDGY